jgi:hypothetical protein
MKLSEIRANPNNPRIIKDEKFHKLVESIRTFPEMLKLRPIVINDDNIVLGGNMRLKACKEAGMKTVPVIKASELTEEQQREFIIKDNVGFGEWDWEMLANGWDAEKLEEWGLDIPDLSEEIDNMQDGEVLHVEKSLQVLPKNEYVLIYAKDGSEEWDELKRIFSCRIVRQGGCRKGSASDKATTGLERVFSFDMFKQRMLNEFRGSNTQ